MSEESHKGADSVEGESITLDPSTDPSVAPVLAQISMLMPGFSVPKFILTRQESRVRLTCSCDEVLGEDIQEEDVVPLITRHVAQHFGLEGMLDGEGTA